MKLWAAVKRKLNERKLDKDQFGPGPGVISPVSSFPPLSPQMQKLMGFAEEPPVESDYQLECEICHQGIKNRNDVVCLKLTSGDRSGVSFAAPGMRWGKLVCSSKCAHALLDQQIVTWRLQGLFNIPDEVDDY